MPVKRRNHGRSKMNRGSVPNKQCTQCRRTVPKDKAISKNCSLAAIETAAMDDLNVATIYDKPVVPVMKFIEDYCVSCAHHLGLAKTRSHLQRKTRA